MSVTLGSQYRHTARAGVAAAAERCCLAKSARQRLPLHPLRNLLAVRAAASPKQQQQQQQDKEESGSVLGSALLVAGTAVGAGVKTVVCV